MSVPHVPHFFASYLVVLIHYFISFTKETEKKWGTEQKVVSTPRYNWRNSCPSQVGHRWGTLGHGAEVIETVNKTCAPQPKVGFQNNLNFVFFAYIPFWRPAPVGRAHLKRKIVYGLPKVLSRLRPRKLNLGPYRASQGHYIGPIEQV